MTWRNLMLVGIALNVMFSAYMIGRITAHRECQGYLEEISAALHPTYEPLEQTE
jgi:hypothetical protein